MQKSLKKWSMLIVSFSLAAGLAACSSSSPSDPTLTPPAQEEGNTQMDSGTSGNALPTEEPSDSLPAEDADSETGADAGGETGGDLSADEPADGAAGDLQTGESGETDSELPADEKLPAEEPADESAGDLPADDAVQTLPAN